MSKPGYLSINITPARRLNLDDARFVMRQPKASDIEVIDFAIGWFLTTARRLAVDARNEKAVRRAMKQSKTSDEAYNATYPATHPIDKALEAATSRNKGARRHPSERSPHEPR